MERYDACAMNGRAAASMLPQVGAGGGTPRPRKDSALSVMMAFAIPSVAATMIGETTLGKIWRRIIRRGGVTITPADIEAALLKHPGIAEAAIVPVPDARLGEKARELRQMTVEALHPVGLAADDGHLRSGGQLHVDQANRTREPQGLRVAMVGRALGCRVIPALDEQDAEQQAGNGENQPKCATRLGHRLLDDRDIRQQAARLLRLR